MKETSVARRSAFPRLDVLDELFAERFNITGTDNASDVEREKVTGVGWLTWYRYRAGVGTGDARRQLAASGEAITAVMATFPDQDFFDLFDPREKASA